MEVSNISPFPSGPASKDSQNFAQIDTDMDIDMDIGFGPDEEDLGGTETEAMKVEPQPSQALEGTQTTSDDPSQVAAHKVHLRGVDNLHTSDIKKFSSEHFLSSEPLHVEWIDDASANLVYDSPETASAALASLSFAELGDTSAISLLQTRMAKGLSTHPESRLEVRIAVLGDKKQPKARERSRYYLFHPEHDPGERRRRDARDRRGDRNQQHEGDYRRRRYDDREERRRRDQEREDGFDASMYDDNASTGNLSHSQSVGEERGRGSPRELFPERTIRGGRARRGRSASPSRDADGDESMTTSRRDTGRLRERSYTPPSRRRRPASPPRAKSNETKELFPNRSAATDTSAGLRGSSPARSTKELFPNRMVTSVHRRSGAFDAADETADLFAGRMSVPFTDGSREKTGTPRSLADRISREPTEPTHTEEQAGFSIRGAAQQQDNSGFSIRGAAGPEGKELFPLKNSSNAGKELFSETLEGRGGRRRKAADMFY